jgi:aspartyl-tRNA synthetase
MLRTHTCGQLNAKNIWEEVVLTWWARHRRDHGWVIFIDLADRYGITQVVFDPEHNKKAHEIADKVRNEYVLKVKWKVRPRPEGQTNPKLVTWEIEVIIDDIEILSESKPLPFEVDEYHTNAGEEIRYKHRYLDLRRKPVLDKMIFRNKMLNFTRNWFYNRDFMEVQTPILANSSPEWARDYLVPSRLNPGKFYALPQAPQQYKQLLMVGGIDKYFQVAPCFRDEDPRADRHAGDFYQIDCEMSFVEQEDIFQIVENFMKDLISNLAPEKEIINNEFVRLTYEQAMEQYGTDKPDLRYDMKMIDVADIFERSSNDIFSTIAKDKEKNRVKALKVPGGDNIFSKSQMKNFEKRVKQYGAQGLGYFQVKEEGLKWPLNKFFTEEDLNEIISRLDLKVGDVVFFGAGKKDVVLSYMWKFRDYLADLMWLKDNKKISLVWITDFPMFEKDETTGKIDFSHNPFSAPQGGYEAIADKEWEELLDVKAYQYDLVMNGYEILSGSIRNTDIKALVKAFEKVGRNEQEVKEKFGAMYEAFQYWVPPHGGFAIGMDRVMMILTDEDNVREVYAFPKTWKGIDLMMNSPSKVDEEQLEELHIKLDVDEDE